MVEFAPCCKCGRLITIKINNRTDGLVCKYCNSNHVSKGDASLFYIELNNDKTIIVSMPCKAKILNEIDSVAFLNQNDEIIVLYKLSEIKGFFKDDRTLCKDGVIYEGR